MNAAMFYMPLLLKGLLVTISAWFLSSILSLIIGFFGGILASRYSCYGFIKKIILLYAFIARAVPAYVHILLFYFIIPDMLGISLSAFTCGCIALGFCSGGYTIGIISSAINNVASGQWDAAYVLGYSRYYALKNIILPQAFLLARISLLGECEQLLKSTSLLSIIGVMELMRSGANIISRELNPLLIYILIAIIYVICSLCFRIVFFYMQKKEY